jgi:hypothetical protein
MNGRRHLSGIEGYRTEHAEPSTPATIRVLAAS